MQFLLLALVAFGGLGLEALLAYCLEPLLYGCGMQDWNTGQMIVHWILTCISWGLVACYAARDAKKSCGFDLFAEKRPMRCLQWAGIAFSIAVAVIVHYLDWGGLKIVEEFEKKGALLFTFQHIYYAFETVLFLLIIVFAQKAFETWFRHPDIPYGGIICGLTWGFAHTFTKGSLSAGIEGILFGFLMGAAYLFAGRDVRKAYVVLLVMFIL